MINFVPASFCRAPRVLRGTRPMAGSLDKLSPCAGRKERRRCLEQYACSDNSYFTRWLRFLLLQIRNQVANEEGGNVETKRRQLAAIVGEDNVLDDPKTLEEFSSDESLCEPLRPWFVVRPANEQRGSGAGEMGQRDGDAAGAGELRGASLLRRHGSDRDRGGHRRPQPHEGDQAHRSSQPDRRHRAGRHLQRTGARLGQGRTSNSSPAGAARQQVGRRQPARAATDHHPAAQFLFARAVEKLRRGVGKRRSGVHRRSGQRAAESRSAVAEGIWRRSTAKGRSRPT